MKCGNTFQKQLADVREESTTLNKRRKTLLALPDPSLRVTTEIETIRQKINKLRKEEKFLLKRIRTIEENQNG